MVHDADWSKYSDADLDKLLSDEDLQDRPPMATAPPEGIPIINFGSPEGEVDFGKLLKKSQRHTQLPIMVYVKESVPKERLKELMGIWVAGFQSNYIEVRGIVKEEMHAVGILFTRFVDYEKNKDYLLAQEEVNFVEYNRGTKDYGKHTTVKPEDQVTVPPQDKSRPRKPAVAKGEL